MATGLYVNGKESLGRGAIDLVNDDMILLLIDTSLYTVDLDNDVTQADIPQEAVIAERSLTGNSFQSGIFNCEDLIFPSLSSEQAVGAFIIAKNTNTLSTTRLVFYNDNAPEFPITPDGTDFTIAFDNGATKIFKL